MPLQSAITMILFFARKVLKGSIILSIFKSSELFQTLEYSIHLEMNVLSSSHLIDILQIQDEIEITVLRMSE